MSADAGSDPPWSANLPSALWRAEHKLCASPRPLGGNKLVVRSRGVSCGGRERKPTAQTPCRGYPCCSSLSGLPDEFYLDEPRLLYWAKVLAIGCNENRGVFFGTGRQK